MSDSLWPHWLQHTRLSCSSPSPGICLNSCPLSQWFHPSIILCCSPLLLSSIFPSIRVFSNESTLHITWPKNWSFSFSISPYNEYSGLISFRIDWFDLLAVHRTLKSLVQHHSLKTSVFFGTRPSLWPNSHIHAWLLEKPQLWIDRPLSAKWCLWFWICCLVLS